MKHFKVLLAVLTMAMMLLPQWATADDEVQIGVILPLSGSVASLGNPALQGINIALEEVNASGGVLGGKKLKLIVEDTESRPKGAMDAIHKLVDVDRVPIVLGEITSSSTMPTAEYSGSKGVVQIGLSATSPNLRQLGPNFFSMVATDEVMGRAMVSRAYKDTGKKKFGILVMNDAYGVGIGEQMQKAVEKMGGQVVSEVRYELNKTDYRAEIQRLFSRKPEVILSVSWGEVSRLIQKQAWELGFAKKLNENWYSAYFSDSVSQCIPETTEGRKGLDVVSAPGPRYDNIVKKYHERAGADKLVTYFVPVGYDAVWVTALAIDLAGSTDSAAIQKVLPTAFKIYRGVSDPDMTVDADGIQTTQVFGTFKYEGGKIVRYQ